jgi:hypothetical protein
LRRPPVIIASHSRQASRISCRANHVRAVVDQRDEQVFEAGIVVPVLLAQFGQGAFGDKPSGRDDADPVGHPLGDFENVRGHDYGAARTHAIPEQSLDVTRGDGVKPG